MGTAQAQSQLLSIQKMADLEGCGVNERCWPTAVVQGAWHMNHMMCPNQSLPGHCPGGSFHIFSPAVKSFVQDHARVTQMDYIPGTADRTGYGTQRRPGPGYGRQAGRPKGSQNGNAGKGNKYNKGGKGKGGGGSPKRPAHQGGAPPANKKQRP